MSPLGGRGAEIPSPDYPPSSPAGLSTISEQEAETEKPVAAQYYFGQDHALQPVPGLESLDILPSGQHLSREDIVNKSN